MEHIGHYLNLIYDKNAFTGFAYSEGVNDVYKYIYAQEFWTGTSNASYTVDEYEALFDEYYNKIVKDMNLQVEVVAEDITNKEAEIEAKKEEIRICSEKYTECLETISTCLQSRLRRHRRVSPF